MENKKLGILFVIFSIVFLLFLFYFNANMNRKSEELGCNVSEECEKVSDFLTFVNIGFGFFGFMLGLGVYILFFNKSEERILKRLDNDRDKKSQDEKFEIILKALDDYEKRVLKAVKEQDGVTQNTLRLRTDMSKAKLSYVLQDLEKRNLIKRVPEGKTLKVFLRV